MDKDCRGYLAGLRAESRLPLHGDDVAQMRARYAQMNAELAQTVSPPQIPTEEIAVPGAVGVLAARLYRPATVEGKPLVVYFHGGGHVLGDIDSHDAHVRWLASDTGLPVLSVNYRLAPESKWPAAAEDAIAATAWAVADFGDTLGCSGVAVAGDSAGGNLAAVALNHHDEFARQLSGALLCYPALDFSIKAPYPSRLEPKNQAYLTVADMAWFGAAYAGRGAPVADPDLSPITANLQDIPPTVVAVAQFDPLRDEGLAYVDKARRAGAAVTAHVAADMPHGYLDLVAVSASARRHARDVHALFASQLRG